MEDLIKWFFSFAEHQPDFIALLIGTLAGYVLTVAIETYWLPIVTEPIDVRRQKGLTFLICWGTSSLASALMWTAIDPKDKVHVIAIVSGVVGILSFAIYPLIGKALTKYIPSIGSAWSHN